MVGLPSFRLSGKLVCEQSGKTEGRGFVFLGGPSRYGRTADYGTVFISDGNAALYGGHERVTEIGEREMFPYKTFMKFCGCLSHARGGIGLGPRHSEGAGGYAVHLQVSEHEAVLVGDAGAYGSTGTRNVFKLLKGGENVLLIDHVTCSEGLLLMTAWPVWDKREGTP